MLEAIPLPTLVAVITSLGVPGLVLLMSYDNGRRMDRYMTEFQKQTNEILAIHQKQTNDILAQYCRDIATVTRYYENNVDLVKHYEKLSNDLTSVIHMNTQVMTHLVEKISNNHFCPLVRQKGPSNES